MKNKTLLLMLLLISATNAFADINIVVPFYTKHIKYDSRELTENFSNTALGLEYAQSDFDVGAVYVSKNSYDKKSIYTYATFYLSKSDLRFGVSALAIAGGYDKQLTVTPALVLKYKWIRAITTYPGGKLTSKEPDLINVQFIVPIKF